MANYIRQLKRKSNKRRIIKGYGIKDKIIKYYNLARTKLKKNIPKAWNAVKRVGKKHVREILNQGIPINKESLINRGKNFAREAFQEARRDISGEGRLRRLRQSYAPYRIPQKVRYSSE